MPTAVLNLFDHPLIGGMILYNPWLVALSVAIGCLGGIAALQLVSIARHRERFGPSVSWLAGNLAWLTLGASVWNMHFIGMLAADLCQPVSYQPLGTALSMLPAMVAAAWAVQRLVHPPQVQHKLWRDAPAGVVMGLGVGAMHYSGLAAMQTQTPLRFDAGWFIASLVVAVTMATAGLVLRQWLLRRTPLPRMAVLLISGSVLGLSISTMHYTAMQATWVPEPAADYVRWQGDQIELALAVAALTVIVFGLAWSLTGMATYRAMARNLAERSQLLNDVLANLPGAVVRLGVERDMARLMVSEQLGQLTGRSVAAYREQTWNLMDAIHPQDQAALRAQFNEALANGQRIHTTARLLTPGGTLKWVDLHISPRGLGTAQAVLDIYLTDVTEEHRLREQEQSLLQGVDRVIGRGTLSRDMRFVDVNTQMAHALGYTPAELAGMPHRAIWPAHASEEDIAAFWRTLLDGQPHSGTFTRQAKDGSLRHFVATYQPLRDGTEQVSRILKLAVDVTEQVEMVSQLKAANDAVQRSMASQNAFFANISHEIRTPMNAIIGFAELLRTELPPGAQLEKVETIHASAQGLLRIVNDLLDVAKMERGEFAIEHARFDLAQLVDALGSQMGMLAHRKGLAMHVHWPPELPRCWLGDADRIRQILTNLLGNALKFTEHGHISLTVQAHEQGIALAVCDSGPGIAPERQAAIFQPFVQESDGTARRYGGTGLGLHIAKQLAERMGGRITLHSVPGQGSRFTVWLPLLPSADCPDPDPATRLPVPGGSPVAAAPEAAATSRSPHIDHRLHVLLADDVAVNRMLLQQWLLRLGHTAEAFEDGERLVGAYTAQPMACDVVLLDLHMPGWGGPQTCARLRQWEREHGIPPVALYAVSASVMEEDQRQAQQAGMNGFLSKPLQIDELLRTLGRIPRRSPPPGQTSPQPDAVWPHAVPAASTGSVIPPVLAATDRSNPTHPPAPPESPPSDAAAPTLPLIDTAAAQRLWGSQWGERACQWAAEAALQSPDWARTPAEGLHRWVGTASALGLARLAALARAAEAAARHGPVSPALLQQLADCHRDTVLAVSHAVAPGEAASSRAAPSPSDPAPPSGLAAPASPQALPWVQRLLAAAQAHETDEAALEALRPHVAQAQWQALHAAFERFDFHAARQQLAAWAEPTASPEPPAGSPPHA